MDDEIVDADRVRERGLVLAPESAWTEAVRRAEVIGSLAEAEQVGLAAVDAAASALGLGRRHVYALLRLIPDVYTTQNKIRVK